jgi:exodeoxyribonuclease VII large subunit
MAQGELSFFDREPDKVEQQPPAVKKVAPPVPRPYTVTQLTRLIKLTLNQHLPDKITLEAEISNFKRHGSGHLYFTLKDESAQIPAVMWKSDVARLKFDPADGLAVVASGRVDVFERDGRYQFYVDKLQPAGAGALELAFRQLAEKLRREGLFEPQHKKPIPTFPQTIAIVTSATGAAIEDIGKTLHRRCPIVRKLLYPVAVQGEGAAAEIAQAILELNRRRDELAIDVIILARGGGSIEDLWAFNEEVVARAVYASKIPIITGIGHEIDTTIADLIADCRAATPTAAAELAVPVLADLRLNVQSLTGRLLQQARRQIDAAANRLSNLSTRPIFVRPADLIRHRQQQIDERQETLRRQIVETLRRRDQALERCAQAIRRIEPHRFLGTTRNRLLEQKHRLYAAMQSLIQRQKHQVEQTYLHLNAAGPARRFDALRLKIDNLTQRLINAQRQLDARRKQSLTHLAHRFESINPRAVLARGYSITRLKATGRLLTAETAVQPGDLLRTELAHDTILDSQAISPPMKKDTRHE